MVLSNLGPLYPHVFLTSDQTFFNGTINNSGLQSFSGTDSKLGVGFRLGPNADVQFQLELGPQTNTLPIGGGTGSSAAVVAKKRHATVGQGDGLRGKPKDWLNAWRLQMSPGHVADDESDNAVSGQVADGDGTMDAVAHLRQLYKPQPMTA